MNRFNAALVLLALTLSHNSTHAWDAVGHRLTVSIALTTLDEARKAQLEALLQHHPRYQQDFLDAMPAFIRQADAERRLDWLLGQAAFWPDMARGLPQAQAQRFNRPSWHYIDGRWLRDAATVQGNLYFESRPLTNITGADAASIQSEQLITNVMTALDYNTALLIDSSKAAADRALALCWVLHLMGDIHQPLHAGALFSNTLFAQGDRGGNGIDTDSNNLHIRWDRALSDSSIADNLRTILLMQRANRATPALSAVLDWSQWLAESRQLLLTEVYDQKLLAEIELAEQRGQPLSAFTLDNDYVVNMQDIARQRIGIAGIRIALWLQINLP